MQSTTGFEVKVSEKNYDLPTHEKTVKFIKIPASELKLEDEWFENYHPSNDKLIAFKEKIEKVIKRGVKDFYRPNIDPSFNSGGTGICYMFGSKPATGKSYNWWVVAARDFYPKCKSRLAKESEYYAFSAYFIKRLVEIGWKIDDAWEAVYKASKELGHYYDSEDAKHALENTGSREILGFCDLINTYKIFSEDEDNEEEKGLCLAGGCYMNKSYESPLGEIIHNEDRDYEYRYGVGLVVMEEDPYAV